MSENYIVINGKKTELTAEQMKAWKIEKEKERKNPFKRVAKFEPYYIPAPDGTAFVIREDGDGCDDAEYDAANYFDDEEFANQVALHQLLYRKLLKFAYDNNFIDTNEWDGIQPHYFIVYDIDRVQYTVSFNWKVQTLGIVYFVSQEAACTALEEVVKPFVTQHPEFVR